MKITKINLKWIILLIIYVAAVVFIYRKAEHKIHPRRWNEYSVRSIYQTQTIEFIKEKSKTVNISKTEMAILVVTCDRTAALKNLLEKILKYRPSTSISIVVSQDCDVPATRKLIESKFDGTVEYIKHKKEGYQPVPGKNYLTYSYIAFHYKNALNYMFNVRKFETVVIVEDDLDIAQDFFSYFITLRKVLLEDPTLYCVSAWNHNGSPELINPTATTLLHRTDFFTGLGWMLTRSLWEEIGPKWPIAFWDDWLLAPEQRKNRQCIRPEVGRTSMTQFGKTGASGGEFFKNHIERVVLNSVPVNFKKLDLSYLKPDVYGELFDKHVAESRVVQKFEDVKNCKNETFKYYYVNFARTVRENRLGLMEDTRSGVPRNSYKKIVPFVYRKCRVFLVPKMQ